MKSRNSLCSLVCGTALLAVAGTASANLIVNGDFQAGDTGFTTDYTPNQIGLTENTYSIVNNPYGSAPTQHPLATSYYDHTLGSANGYMMAVNGAGDASKKVWAQTVSGLVIGQKYEFSLWVSTWYPANAAVLDVAIDGYNLATFSAPATTAQWEQHSFLWTATSTSAGFTAIYDNTTVAFGNDFALDDISLKAVPDGGLTSMLLGMGMLGLGYVRRMVK